MWFLLKRRQHSPSWLLGPHIFHEERSGWKRRAAGKAGSLCSRTFAFLYLCVAHSTYLSQPFSTFFHMFPVPVLLCCMCLRYASCLFPAWCEQREMTLASCCHWALLQLICSLIASLAFVLFLTQWPSTKETLSQSAVCLCVGVRFIVKHHVVQLLTVNIDDCYWRCSVNQTRPWMLTF